MKLKQIIFSLIVATGTNALFAQTTSSCTGTGICFEGIKNFINNTNSYVVATFGMLVLAVSVVGFFVGVVRFIWAQQAGDTKGVENGKELLKWGIIALFCAFSVYGIIQFMQGTIFGKTGAGVSNIVIPKLTIDTSTTNGNAPLINGSQPGGNAPSQSGNGNAPLKSGSGTVYDGSNPSTAGAGRGSSGPCQSGGYNGSYQNGSCVPDYSSPIKDTSSSVNYCSYASIGKLCESGTGKCQNTQVGIECVKNGSTNVSTSGRDSGLVSNCSGISEGTPCDADGSGTQGLCDGIGSCTVIGR